MPTIAEVRQQYPQYGDMSDGDLAGALHRKFYSDLPRAEFDKKIGLSSTAETKPHDQEPADHGLSERQKMSPVEKALSPITGYPATYDRMNKEARDQMSRGVDQLSSGFSSAKENSFDGAWEATKGAANVALGGIGYIASPISAAYRSVAGQPIEDTTGIPREYTEFGLQLATPGLGFPGAGRTAPSVVKAEQAVTSAAPVARPVQDGLAGASERLAATGNPVEVPRAIASDSMAVQRAGQGIRNMPIVGDAIPKATARMGEQLEGAASGIASEYGGGSGPNVAHSIGQRLGTAAEQETAAAKASAAQSDQAVLAAYENSIRGANDTIAGHEAAALTRARQAVGDMSPQDMGETLIARLRQGEREAWANKERLYGIAGNSDAAIDASAVRSLRADVSAALDKDGLFVDATPGSGNLTPAARAMMQDLDNAPVENILKRTPPKTSEPAPSPSITSPKPTAAPQSTEPAPQSLLEFLASKGGLGPDAELSAIGAHSHTVSVEGLGRRKLTRQGGLPLDYAREAAEEAGYLRGDHKGTSTVNDLLDAIDAEMRGQKRYAEGFEGTVGKRASAARSEREQHEYSQHIIRFEDELSAAGHDRLSGDVKHRTIQLMSNEGMKADAAVKRALYQLEQDDKITHSVGNQTTPSVNMQDLENTRKRLNAMSRAATNDADRRAAGRIIRAYDDWLDDAFDKSLFSGSDEALNAYRQARAANADWRTRFGHNSRDDADRVINRIVTGEVTAQEVSNYIVGASKVGSKGVSSRLLTRITEATGGDPEAIGAIRGGVWNRVSSSTEGVTAKSGARVADDINEFFNGSGRDVANRLFTEPQRGIAMAYARALRQGDEARALVSDVAANTRPAAMEVGIGPMQKLANDVLGKSGNRSDEALYSAINSYAKSGARGDVALLSQIVQAIPLKDRGNLAGAMIKDMGVSKRTGQFSPDVFVSTWGTYTPQAKSVLFGMSGPQRIALDDIAAISLRMKEVGSKFGNPSGTAQNVNILALGSALIAAPLTTIAGAVGGAVTAKILSTPIGASSVSKWSRSYERVASLPSPGNIEAFNRATTLLALNVQRDTGVPVKDLIRQLQGPVPVAADDKQK